MSYIMMCFREGWLFIALYVLLLLSYVCEPVASDFMRYDRVALLDWHQFWRLLTAHLVHLNFNHMILNGVGLLLVIICCGSMLGGYRGLLFFVGSSLFTSIGLLIISPELYRYVGLSGVLHGFLMLALWVSPYYSSAVKYIFIGVIVAKVIWEQTPFYSDAEIKVLIEGNVIVNAHLLGAIAGVISIVLYEVFYLDRFLRFMTFGLYKKNGTDSVIKKA